MSLINSSLVLTGPNMLRLENTPVKTPRWNEVQIRIDSASICHTDFVVIEGQYSRINYPTIPGHEFSGVIEKIGEGVINFNPGDRVAALGYYYCGVCNECKKERYTACKNIKGIPMDTDGAYQQIINVPDNSVYKIADSVSLEEAALTEPAANGFAAVETAKILPGETVVVIGPGPIGLLALQASILKCPSKVIMLGTRYERLRLADELGATHTINVNNCDAFNAIMETTQFEGVDVVLFCGGGRDAWDLSSRVLKKFGRIVIEALPDPYNAQWPVPVCDFTEKSISYLGVSGYSPKEFAQTLDLIAMGKIRVAPLITHRFPLRDYMEAFATAKERKDGAIKVVIKPNM